VRGHKPIFCSIVIPGGALALDKQSAIGRTARDMESLMLKLQEARARLIVHKRTVSRGNHERR
jgi:hypothetical protein